MDWGQEDVVVDSIHLDHIFKQNWHVEKPSFSSIIFKGNITSPGHETPLASGVSTNVSVDVDSRQHDSEAGVDA
eukprot:scaffold10708_cov130-Amphora_coffeaeformis.AAC.3